MKVTSLRKGSVIVDYSIFESPDDNLDNLGKLLGNMIEFGMVDVGGPISSYGIAGEDAVTPKTYVEPEVEEQTSGTGDVITEDVKPKGKGGAIAGIVIGVIFFIGILGLALFWIKKKKSSELITKVSKTELVEAEAEQGYDANDLIRNRKENEADSVDMGLDDETKTLGNISNKSRHLTPKK